MRLQETGHLACGKECGLTLSDVGTRRELGAKEGQALAYCQDASSGYCFDIPQGGEDGSPPVRSSRGVVAGRAWGLKPGWQQRRWREISGSENDVMEVERTGCEG